RVVGPGEPVFLPEDTDLAVALAEEEADTCGKCGMPKVWCRDPAYSFGAGLDVHEDMCWTTYRVQLRREKLDAEGAHGATRQAMQIRAAFKKGAEPDMGAGLDLPDRD